VGLTVADSIMLSEVWPLFLRILYSYQKFWQWKSCYGAW